MRVFLDTNVLVSAFTTRGICADVLAVTLAEHELVLGETVLTELDRVLRDKMQMPDSSVKEADAFLRRQAQVAQPLPALSVAALRDPDDVSVLREAMAGASDVLVSGDRDLLDIAAELPIHTISPRGFWEMLQQRR